MIKNRRDIKALALNQKLSLKFRPTQSPNLNWRSTFEILFTYKLLYLISCCKSKLKVRRINIMKCIANKNLFSKNHRKVASQKNPNLPFLNGRDRKVKSPTKMSELTFRMASPTYFKNRKNTSAPLPSSILTPRLRNVLNANTTQWTEEQSIISERAKIKVMEARMSRFTGFKSPRILLNKLLDQMNTSDQNDFDTINLIEGTDEVLKSDKWKINSLSFKVRNRDLANLSL